MKMDNTAEQYGQRRSPGARPYDSSLQGQSPAGMADTDVDESKLRGLDVFGASLSTIMMLGPLAAVAVLVH
jgi:hypothetical protein